MTGTLIISLDCEGKWGLADAPSSVRDFMTRANLASIYRDIIELFEERDLKATFAFVAAFIMTEDERSAFDDHFVDIDYRGANWLRHFRADSQRGEIDGWFCPEAFDMAKDQGHEIASHGFCHVPFDDEVMPASVLAAEVAAAVKLAKAKDVTLETFIYPRNRVAHPEILRDLGFKGYRTAIKQQHKALSLLREGHVFDQAQPHGDDADGMIRIPAGYFFNWRKGLRAKIPKAVTLARWKSILQTAADQNKVAHLWLHPHNLISGPETLDSLREVLNIATGMRDDGRLLVQTQADYARAMKGRAEAQEMPDIGFYEGQSATGPG